MATVAAAVVEASEPAGVISAAAAAFRGMGGGGMRSGMGGLNRSFAVRSSSMGRSVSSFRSTRQFHTRSFTRMSSSRALTRNGNVRFGSNSLANRSINRQFARNNSNLVTGSVNGAARTSLVRNTALASFASRNGHAGMLRQASFNGNWTGRNWRNWNGGNWHGNNGWWWRNRPIFVIGWFGPVFWPFAYWDFIDYTFWPYAYDAFWPYAFDDVYVGVFGPYAYEGRGYANVVSSRRHARRTRDNATTTSVVCGEQAPALTNWPIEQISQTVQPTDAQQAAAERIKGRDRQSRECPAIGLPRGSAEHCSRPTGGNGQADRHHVARARYRAASAATVLRRSFR